MKLSSNSVGMLIFTALAIAVFVLMALRPAVDGNAMNFGVPLSTDTAASTMSPETTPMEAPATEAEAEPAPVTIEQNTSSENVSETSTETVTPESTAPDASTEEVNPTAEEGVVPDTEETKVTN